ncbi:MAG: hypothetical protein ACFE78_14510 [Candidatus Hodarchaeota archaeon]
MLYLLIAWLSFLINHVFTINLLLNPNIESKLANLLGFIDNFFLINASFFIVLFGESISRKIPSNKKLIWFSIFIGFYSYSSYLNYFIFNRIDIIENVILLNFYVYAFSFLILISTGGFLMAYYLFKIYRVAPFKLKKYVFLSFIGGILLGIVTPISIIIMRLILLLDIGLSVLLASIGMLTIFTAIFAKNPKLAFILPFKVMRLSVINSNDGNLLYSHNWKSGNEIKDDDIVSMMFQGIITILRESLGKGDLHEINLENAVVIAQKSIEFPVVYILIATSTSKSLKNGLNTFIKHFELKFSKFLEKIIDFSVFSSASEIVFQSFSFLPD